MKYTQQNGSERVLVVKGLEVDLIPGRQYEVEVSVESLGIFRSRRKNFSKLETYYYCINHILLSPLHMDMHVDYSSQLHRYQFYT